MQKRATARDVAEAAGVSKWTVMRAFTDGASISEDKKRRVLEAAEALNFSPNLLARSLVTNLTHQVAVFVDDFANPQKLPYLEVLTDRLQAEGLIAMLVNINNHFDHVHALLNAGQRQVDAVILFGTAFRDETLTDRRLGRSMPPTFVLARDSQIDGVPAVVCDAERALREIVDHLYERGYRRPGFMAGPKVLSTALGRQQHFLDSWAEKGLSDVVTLTANRYDSDAGTQCVREYLERTPPAERVDVLMCENDILALGVLDVVRSGFGLRVPQEMAVVGFDNFNLLGVATYGLTTYEQPIQGMVDQVVSMILGHQEPETVSLPGKLIVRETT